MANKKVKMAAHRIAFLMEHQRIIPDLKEIATDLLPSNVSNLDNINRDSPEYLLGAYEALTSLIAALEGKGF